MLTVGQAFAWRSRSLQSQDRTRSGLALERLESLLPGGQMRVKGGFAVAPRWRR